RRDPDRVHAQRGHVVQPVGDARKVAHAVAVGVEETAGVDLVDDGAAPPLVIGHTGTITVGMPRWLARRGGGPAAVQPLARCRRRTGRGRHLPRRAAFIGRRYGSGGPSRPSRGAYVFIANAF